MRFIIFINDDNEGLTVINLMHLNIINVVFIILQHFVFPINIAVNKAINSYWNNASVQQNIRTLFPNCVLTHRLALS